MHGARWLVPLVLSSLGSFGCGGDPPPDPATPRSPLTDERARGAEGSLLTEAEDQAGASRVDVERTGGSAGGAIAAPPVSGIQASRPMVYLTALTDVPAEDGVGGQAPASRATAINLDAHRFPARALDPVLHLGQLVLRRYTHPRVGLLRFVIADVALPPDGTPMFVEYEGDPASRVDLDELFDRASISPESP